MRLRMISRPQSLVVLAAMLAVAASSCESSRNPSSGGSVNGGGSGSGARGGSALGGTDAGGSAGESTGTGGSSGSASGASGTSGEGGEPSTGGDAGAPSGGASGASGTAGDAGSGGTGRTPVPGCTPGTSGGTPDVCSFEIACALSSAIPTVGVIDWSTDLEDLSDVRIEFTLNDPRADEINRGSGGPIDISGTTHRALLLGLKPQRTYTYRIVAESGGTVCTSPDQTIATGSATGAPIVTRAAEPGAARANGFIVTSVGYPGRGAQKAYVIDADGHVVWWADSPGECSRALLDWEGTAMWMVDTNSSGTPSGQVRRVAMDGTGAEIVVEGLTTAHHDIAVVPGGIVAFLLGAGDTGASDLVERSPDGTLRTVVRLDGAVFASTQNNWHANSITYHPTDDTYTIGDRNAGAYVKLTREGELVWQLGRDCTGALAPKCASVASAGNHGHHLLDTGNFLGFAAGFSESAVFEHRLTETSSSLSAELIWSYGAPGTNSMVLGDVQRLPNGNTLVVFSTAGRMHEVTETGELVQIIRVHSADPPGDGSFGYANFRETLYGPPDK